ncbi:MAG: hypothetical protein JSU90_02075 [Nitrospiraceae bacterium]|nr:MAG: hypothetical protein JSU90_02075 [Nitrospiraceae bacterium]
MHDLKTILLLIVVVCMLVSIPAAARCSDDVRHQTGVQDRPVSFFTNPAVTLLSEYYTNSSDFTRQSIGTEAGVSASSGVHFDAGYVFSDFSQDGFDDVLRHTLIIQGERQFSESITVLGRLSENFYDNENENLNGGLFLRFRPVSGLYTEFSYRHFDLIDTVPSFSNVIYSYVVTIGSLDLDIQSDDYKVYLLYYPVSRVSFAGEAVYGDYSDGNEKHSFMFEAGYQVFDAPFLRAAYNYFYLDIKDPAPLTRTGDHVESAYWDPINFEIHTLRLEYRQDFRENLSWGAEGALSWSPKSSGLSTSAFLFALYRFTQRSSLRFDARWFDQNEGVDRLEEGDRFWAANFNIIYQHRF